MRKRSYLQAIVRKYGPTQEPIIIQHRDLHEEVLAAFVADPDIRFSEALEVVELVQAGKAEGDTSQNRRDRLSDIMRPWAQDPNLPEIVQRVHHVADMFRTGDWRAYP